MVIYIITKSGRILKDEAIQYILERLALAENEKNYIYRCPDVNIAHHKLLTEFEGLKHGYKILFYNTIDECIILNDSEKDTFIQELKQPLNWEVPLHKILSKQIRRKS